jgi:hypothetical protein
MSLNGVGEKTALKVGQKWHFFTLLAHPNSFIDHGNH